jgi:hypothetical protein
MPVMLLVVNIPLCCSSYEAFGIAIITMIQLSCTVLQIDQPMEPSSRCCHFRNRVVTITVIST